MGAGGSPVHHQSWDEGQLIPTKNYDQAQYQMGSGLQGGHATHATLPSTNVQQTQGSDAQGGPSYKTSVGFFQNQSNSNYNQQ